MGAAAEDFERSPRSLSPPVWTMTPMRVDPSLDTRERLPPRLGSGHGRKRLVVDAFPRLESDASFLGGGRRWRIAFVALPPRSKTCPLDNARSWPCGVRAWAFVSGMLAGARLMCDPPLRKDDPIPSVTCYVDDQSITERILSAGWAEPTADAPDQLVAGFRRAFVERKGLFSPAPPP